MPTFVAPPLPPGCPWSGFAPPNVDWCELERCAWIVNPAGAWSNLAYVALGLWMWHRARRSGDSSLALFGPAAVVVGLCSGVYHASYTSFLQLFDFLGMFLFCFVVITANALRLGWIGPSGRWPLLLAGTLGSTASVPLVSETRLPIQGLVALLIAVIVAQEVAVARRAAPGAPQVRRGWFYTALGLIGTGAAFSLADVTRTWCHPASWLQGHALWHVLSALSLAALFLFYAGLPGARGRVAAT